MNDSPYYYYSIPCSYYLSVWTKSNLQDILFSQVVGFSWIPVAIGKTNARTYCKEDLAFLWTSCPFPRSFHLGICSSYPRTRCSQSLSIIIYNIKIYNQSKKKEVEYLISFYIFVWLSIYLYGWIEAALEDGRCIRVWTRCLLPLS